MLKQEDGGEGSINSIYRVLFVTICFVQFVLYDVSENKLKEMNIEAFAEITLRSP